MKRIICGVLAFSLALSVFCLNAQATSPNSVSGLVSTALSQLDHEEAANGYTEYGQWFGVSNGDWCDMFVSWCAEQAGLSAWVFPRSSVCTTHVQLFRTYGTYHLSMARGGTYIPKQGDVIFFYNYPEYPYGNILRHVGLVLCVENGHVFTIEGNTITNRLDYPYYESVVPLRNYELEPRDYVVVKCYPLDEPQIHGYAVPNYDDTSPLEHTGWIDLTLREIFDTLDAQGAKALYALLSEMPAPAASSDKLLYNGEILDWPLLKIDGSNYVPLEKLKQSFPTLATASEAEDGSEPPAARSVRPPVPMSVTNRVFLSEIKLQNGEFSTNVPSFNYQGMHYVMLRPAVNLFHVDIRWNEERMTIELF